MVRLRFSRSRSTSSLSSSGATSLTRNLNAASTSFGTPPPHWRTNAPNDENATNRGNVPPPPLVAEVAATTATARSNGGDARENRPPSSSSQDSKATKRAAKKVLKLLESPRKVIMNRAKSSSLGARAMGGPSGGARPGPRTSTGAGERTAVPRGNGGERQRPTLQGRSSSVSEGLRIGAASSMIDDTNSNISVTMGLGYRQVSLNTSGICRATSSPRSADKCGQYELFGEKSTGFPIQQEAFFDTLEDRTVLSSHGRLKDDGAVSVLQWLHDEAPQDILPRVLSFAGSRKIDALSRTCKSWRSMTLSDSVWRTACEDTAKWKVGQPLPEGTWLQHYRDNPLVPVDYATIEDAFNVNAYGGSESARRCNVERRDMDANNVRPTVAEHRRSVRVLLRPGKYVIRESLVVHAIGNEHVTIETAEVTSNNNDNRNDDVGSVTSQGYCFRQNLWLEDALMTDEDRRLAEQLGMEEGNGSASLLSSTGRGSSLTPSRLSRRATSLRNLLSCRSSAGSDVSDSVNVGADAHGNVDNRGLSASMPSIAGCGPDGVLSFGHGGSSSRFSCSAVSLEHAPPKRAVIVLKTRTHNEPVVRVRQGTVHLRNLDLIHNASGTDIWNGNAAVQVQPPFDDQDNPLTALPPSTQPTAVLDKINIMSLSGRGVVNIDGGYALINDCYIHNCAATGIYVGGPGSVADVVRTDVVQNGNGNERSRRGIARGHSGVYLEQGIATLRDCNVSDNSLTGISAVSSENATLTVEDTDLMSNGSIQLELPPLGSASHRRSVSRNNSVSAGGRGRLRSGLVMAPTSPRQAAEDGLRRTPHLRRRNASEGGGRDRPQSPAEDANVGGDVLPRSPLAAANAVVAAAATASARRRMRFAALDEGQLAPAAVPIEPMVE